MRIGNVLQCWLWAVPDLWAQGFADVSMAARSGPILVASTTAGRGLSRMCSCSDCSNPARCAPLCRSYRQSRVCESAIFVPQGSPLRCAQPWRDLGLAREEIKPGVGTGEDGAGQGMLH
jgi:hypothetical protein